MALSLNKEVKMTTPTGQISLSQVNTELSYPATQTIGMNDTAVRNLAGVPSGAISMQNLQGKSSVFTFSITTSANVNLRSAALAAGWPGSGAVNATIPSAATVYSNSPGSAALVVDGAWPGGVTLNNQGLIVGRGGNGGNGGAAAAIRPGSPGSSGSTAITFATPISVNNTGIIAGGGGGGGGGGARYITVKPSAYGPGGGGGGGAGGAPGGIPAGGTGTTTAAGAGQQVSPNGLSWGGPGGGYGASGSSGNAGLPAPTNTAGIGGAAGAATSGAPTHVTWIAIGARYGAVN